MPSRKDTMKFIVDNDLKSRLKGFSKNSINELNERVDNLLKDACVVENNWKKLKLKTDASPEQAEATKKLVRRETLKKATPKKATLKKTGMTPVFNKARKDLKKQVGSVKTKATKEDFEKARSELSRYGKK